MRLRNLNHRKIEHLHAAVTGPVNHRRYACGPIPDEQERILCDLSQEIWNRIMEVLDFDDHDQWWTQ